MAIFWGPRNTCNTLIVMVMGEGRVSAYVTCDVIQAIAFPLATNLNRHTSYDVVARSWKRGAECREYQTTITLLLRLLPEILVIQSHFGSLCGESGYESS